MASGADALGRVVAGGEAKASGVEGAAARGPGSTMLPAQVPAKARTINPSVAVSVLRTASLRRYFQLRLGRHGGVRQAQIPSACGPLLQGPPCSGPRVQRQRSPSRTGLHCGPAPQCPLGSGPMVQQSPLPRRPQTHFWFGRW